MTAAASSRSRWAICARRSRRAARSSTSGWTGAGTAPAIDSRYTMKHLLAEAPMYHRPLSSPTPDGAQRSHGYGWPVHRAAPRHSARPLRRSSRSGYAQASANRPRAGGLRARRRDARLPDALGAAADRMAVGRLAGRLPHGLGQPRHRRGLRGDDRVADGDPRARGQARRDLEGRAAGRRDRPARRRAGADLHGHRDRRRARVRLLVPDHRGARADAGPEVKRLFERYRQFQALPADEVSRELRERRDQERAQEVVFVPELDLARTAWHEPPHPEAVNAATFALRRRMNAYSEPAAREVRELAARRHGVSTEQVAVGHGAAELLQEACAALLASDGGDDCSARGRSGELLVAWPGWGPLPELARRVGGRPVPVAGEGGIGPLADRVGADTRAVALSSPNDPTGAPVAREEGGPLCGCV